MAESMLPPLPDQINLDVPNDADASGLSFVDGETALTRAGTNLIDLMRWTSLRLKTGSWLFTWGNNANLDAPFTFGLSDGTFRFEPHGGPFGSIKASGDLYSRPLTFIPRHKVGQIWIGPTVLPGSPPALNQGIPIFGIKQYRAYLRVTKVSSIITNNAFTMEFARYNWDTSNGQFVTDASGAPFVAESYIVRLTWTTAPGGWPNPSDYLTGEVKVKSTGASAGFIRLGWVSPCFRKIGLEIDAVAGCKFPTLNAAGRSLFELLEDAGLQTARLVINESSIPDKADGSLWTTTDLHAAMASHRQLVDLDKE